MTCSTAEEGTCTFMVIDEKKVINHTFTNMRKYPMYFHMLACIILSFWLVNNRGLLSYTF